MVKGPNIKDADIVRDVRNLTNLSEYVDDRNGNISKMIKAIAYSGNRKLYQTAEKVLTTLAVPQMIEPDPFFPPPRPEDVAGEIMLGETIPCGNPFGLERLQLTRNILTTGTIGAGKTTVILSLIGGLYNMGIPFLIVSLAKKDMRHLIRRYPGIQVIRAEDLRLNPLSREIWQTPIATITDFINTYTHQLEIMVRSKSYILSALKELCEIYGRDEDKGQSPNMEDIITLLYNKSLLTGFRRDDFLFRNIQRLEMLMFLSSDIFRCSRGYALEKLLEYPVILELDDVDDTLSNFILVMMITKILRYRIEKRVRGSLLHCLIFDEAKLVFSASNDRNLNGTVAPIDILVDTARDLGEGVIAADQELSKLSDSIKACSNTKFTFFLSGKNILEARYLLGLDAQQLKVLQQLTVGKAIVKMDERFTSPFLVKFAPFLLEKDVTDQEVEEHSREFINWLNQDVRPRSTLLVESMKKGEKNRKLSKNEEMFITHIARRPELTVTERYEAIGFAKYTGDKTLKALFVKGFIKKIVVQTGMRGRQPVIVEITEKGKEYLESAGIKSHAKGKGGAVHQWWQKKIKEFYEEEPGNSVEIEPNHGGANTDVLIIKPEGERISIEVALSFKGQINNIQRDLENFDKVIVAAPSKSLVERIEEESQKILSKTDSEKVSFCLLQSFLEKNNG